MAEGDFTSSMEMSHDRAGAGFWGLVVSSGNPGDGLNDRPKMAEALVAFATELKKGVAQPTAGTHFVAIMGDTADNVAASGGS